MGISVLGMLGYFTFVASLSFVSATTCTVAGSIEIVLAYLCQVRQNYYFCNTPETVYRVAIGQSMAEKVLH